MSKGVAFIKGRVVQGIKKGRQIGYPTINIDISNDISLDHGVYSCKVTINDQPHSAIMHYGTKSIGTDDYSKIYCEIHILDFNFEIYGEEVEVNVLKKIRNMRKFDSEDELAEQISHDIKIAKKHFQND